MDAENFLVFFKKKSEKYILIKFIRTVIIILPIKIFP